jgi:molybdopterin-guanine dinucleotide biosynthesis protein A
MAGQAPQPPTGVVLAGGPGRRLGGDKPLRRVAGRRLIDLALESVGRVCPRVVVSTGQVEPLAELPVELIADRWPGQGPLAAVTTVLMDSGAEAVLVLAVDLPLVAEELLRRLAFGRDGALARAPLGPRGPEPLVAYYHRRCLPAAQRLLARGERRLRMLLKEVDTDFVSQQEVARLDPQGHSFLNVNYPQDLERAAALGRACGRFDTP